MWNPQTSTSDSALLSRNPENVHEGKGSGLISEMISQASCASPQISNLDHNLVESSSALGFVCFALPLFPPLTAAGMLILAMISKGF